MRSRILTVRLRDSRARIDRILRYLEGEYGKARKVKDYTRAGAIGDAIEIIRAAEMRD